MSDIPKSDLAQNSSFISQIEKMDNFTFSFIVVISWTIIGATCFNLFGRFVETFKNLDKKEKKFEFLCYFTGTIHASISTCGGIYSYFYACNGLKNFDCIENPTALQTKVVLFTASFMVYDFFLYYWLVNA